MPLTSNRKYRVPYSQSAPDLPAHLSALAEDVDKDVEALDNSQVALGNKIGWLDGQLLSVNNGMVALNGRMVSLDTKIRDLTARDLDAVQALLDAQASLSRVAGDSKAARASAAAAEASAARALAGAPLVANGTTPGLYAIGLDGTEDSLVSVDETFSFPAPVQERLAEDMRASLAQPVRNNRPMQAASQAPAGRLILGVADEGNTVLSWNQYGLSQSDNGGVGWLARNTPAAVADNYSAAGKAAAVRFKGLWYLQAVKTTDGLPSLFRAAPLSGAGNFSWSGPLITGVAGSNLFSCALDADEKYIYWGEYGDPVGGPALWRSANGTSWEKVISSGSGIGRHIHGVAADPYHPGHVYVSGGDTSSTVYNLVSKDYGATWSPMPHFGTDGAWQACQISFDEDAIYYAADSITAMGAFKVDRATGKPSWLTRESHRNRDIPGGMPPRKITDLATTAGSYKVTSDTANFGPEDVGSRLRTRGQAVVPMDTYIRSVDSSSQVTMWQPSTITTSGLTAIFGGETWGAASYYGMVDARTGIFYFSTLNGAFGGNVDGLFCIYPDGQLVLLNILAASPDARMYIVPERNILWVQGFSHSLLSI